MLVDVVDWNGPDGPKIEFPPNVDLIVTVAQGVAIVLAIAFQSDLIEVVMK